MNIQKQLLTPNRWSRPQTRLNSIKGVVIHWVANANSTAQANRNFFENRKHGRTNFGSAHYIIGLQGEIIQCLPENELAYHVGSNTYTSQALSRLSSYPNNCTLGIECTHIDNQGRMNQVTYDNTLRLAVHLLRKYNLTENDLWLHKTVVGWKDCHRWFVNNNSEWVRFKTLAGQMLRGKANLNPEININDISLSPDFTPLLRIGSRNDRVRELQESLTNLGYTVGNIDGVFGNLTDMAVKSFQRDQNLTVDGIVGDQTLNALKKEEELMKERLEKLEKTVVELTKSITEGKNPNPSAWAKDHWEEVRANGYFDGTNPQAYITREQSAIVVNRLRKNILKLVFENQKTLSDHSESLEALERKLNEIEKSQSL